MIPISVKFSKANVLIVGQNKRLREQMKGVLSSFGVRKSRITERSKKPGRGGKSLDSYDLVIVDCGMDRFSRELLLDELSEDSDAPVVLVAEDEIRDSISRDFEDRRHAVIARSFCPKSLYLKLNLLISEFRSSLVDEKNIRADRFFPSAAL